MGFCHLHVHTEYSFLDGACVADDVMRAALADGQASVAVTDHGNMHGVVEFYQSARESGVKPIIGMEAYVARSRLDRTRESAPDRLSHIVLLARNEEGYRNLIELSTRSFLEGFYYRPRVDYELLEEHAAGLVAMTACLSGDVPKLLLAGREDEALSVAGRLREMFGREHLYIELQDCGLEDQKRVNPMLVELARRLGSPVVATNDVHYVRPEDARIQDILLCIQTNSKVADENRLRFGSEGFYFRSEAQMREVFGGMEEAVSRTVEVAEKCEFELRTGGVHTPSFVPPGGEAAESYLRKLCDEGLRRRYGEPSSKERERLERELEIIERKGFSSYFLIVWDFVRFARESGIPYGPRGSGVGTMVGYCLDISDIDPLRYGLLFERFLDPERNEMPDLDIDVCQQRRGEVIDYLRERYGADYVSQIGTFSRLKARNSIRDVGRVLGLAQLDIDRIAAMVPGGPGASLDLALDSDPELARLYQRDEFANELIEIARKVEGRVRQGGIHAAGVLITDRPVRDYVPLWTSKSKGEERAVVASQWDMDAVAAMGLLKMDLLGLRTLSTVERTLDLVEKRTGERPDLASIDIEDRKVFGLFQRAETAGLFQVESAGMRNLLRRLRPDKLTDIIAAVALFRPGPMQMIDTYIARRHGREGFELPHPIMEEILRETYGVMVYQEQVMQIVNRLGGVPLGRAYGLIKAISKKKNEVIEAERGPFIDGAVAEGVGRGTAEQIFDLIVRFGGYGFNKSHSAGYAMLAYKTAYLKAYYPSEYMAALLSLESGNAEKVSKYFEEAKRMGIAVLPPDVNSSEVEFAVVPDGIRFGLNAVKGVGERAAEAVVRAREELGRFGSIFEFASNVDLRLLNKGVLEALVSCGAFDSLGAGRSAFFEAVPRAVAFGAGSQRDRSSGQGMLFGAAASEPELAELPEWSERELLEREKQALGFHVSRSPLDAFRELISAYSTCTTAELGSHAEEEIVIGGLVTALERRVGRSSGKKYARFVLQDAEGSVDALLAGRRYASCEEFLAPDVPVFVLGRLDTERSEHTLIADEIIPVAEARERLTRSVLVKLDGLAREEDVMARIASLIRSAPGETPVYLRVRGSNGLTVTLKSEPGGVRASSELLWELGELAGEDRVVFAGSGPT